MIHLSQTGVGTVANTNSLRDSDGTGIFPVQAAGDGVTQFRVLGRVSPAAPWVELKAAGTADFLESISWLPYIQLEVTSGTGTVELFIGEK